MILPERFLVIKIEPILKLSQIQKYGTLPKCQAFVQQQKASRHTRILDTASKLFRDHGYDAVKMEVIASAAEVSIGTIYNYYQNKGDLLVAIVAMEVNEVLAAGEKVIAKPPRSAEKAIDSTDWQLYRAFAGLSQQGNVAAGHGHFHPTTR